MPFLISYLFDNNYYFVLYIYLITFINVNLFLVDIFIYNRHFWLTLNNKLLFIFSKNSLKDIPACQSLNLNLTTQLLKPVLALVRPLALPNLKNISIFYKTYSDAIYDLPPVSSNRSTFIGFGKKV